MTLHIEKIKRNLNTKYMGKRIIYLEETTSTNDVGKELAGKDEVEGTVIISEMQTRGRGRMLREWETTPLSSIALSIIIKPDIEPSKAPTLTPVLALSIVEALKQIDDIDVSIKWPNDIFLGNKKLGGILTEMNSGMDEVKYIIIGMGLNVGQEAFKGELDMVATSLKKFIGKDYDRETVISHILNSFEHNYEKFKEYGISYFGERLKAFSCILGKEVIAISGLEMLEGLAEDIDEEGNLILRLEDGRLKKIIYGDVGIKCKELLKG